MLTRVVVRKAGARVCWLGLAVALLAGEMGPGPELARLDQCTHPWPPHAEGFICLGQAGGVCVCLKSKLLREAFVPKQACSSA